MKINFKRINHFQICIPFGEEEKARLFYSGILGLNEIPKPAELIKNGGLWFEIADIQLHIGIENVENSSKRHPAFEVENIEQVKMYLSEKNVNIREEIQIPGQTRFSFFDPFGNRIEILEKKL